MSHLFYRLALSEAALATGANFAALGLPEPTLPTFADFSTRTPAGDGTESRLGNAQGSLFWDRLTPGQAAVIRELVLAAEALSGASKKRLFATIPRTDGKNGWIDISGAVSMPTWETEAGSGGRVYVNVALRFNAVVVENEPSNGV